MIISQPDRILLQRQIEHYAPLLTGEVLDIGSGRSRRYERYCSNVRRYRTLDVDPSGSPDIVGSVEHIPLEDASIDGIICTQVLEHVPHPWVAVAEMARILKPGGICIVTVPQMNELHEEPHDYYRYTKYGLTSLFIDAGLKVQTMDQRGTYYATRAQNEIRQLVNWLDPYNHPFRMWILAPYTRLKTCTALWRDARDTRTASKRHAIGWCVVATKP